MTINFVSKVYPGSISDKDLTEASGVLQNTVPGDGLLVDKGFTIHALCGTGEILNTNFVTHLMLVLQIYGPFNRVLYFS